MSAYLASQQTYDYIASGLYDAAARRDSEPHYTVRRFLELDNDTTVETETLEHTIARDVGKLYDDRHMPVKEICDTLHIGRSTLYRYVGGRTDLDRFIEA